MPRADGVEPLLRFCVGVRTNYPADEDYVVAGLGFRFQRAFKIRDGIGKQHRINLLRRPRFAMDLAMLRIEFCKLVDVPPGP